jgi:hypothetical protein
MLHERSIVCLRNIASFDGYSAFQYNTDHVKLLFIDLTAVSVLNRIMLYWRS